MEDLTKLFGSLNDDADDESVENVTDEKMQKTIDDFGAMINDVFENLGNSGLESDVEEAAEKYYEAIINRLQKIRPAKIDELQIVRGDEDYPFYLSVNILVDGKELDIEFYKLKPEELNEELDTLSADCNCEYADDEEKIEAFYNGIINRLNDFEWDSLCKTKSDFIKLV